VLNIARFATAQDRCFLIEETLPMNCFASNNAGGGAPRLIGRDTLHMPLTVRAFEMLARHRVEVDIDADGMSHAIACDFAFNLRCFKKCRRAEANTRRDGCTREEEGCAYNVRNKGIASGMISNRSTTIG
jgi:hypothetical protein